MENGKKEKKLFVIYPQKRAEEGRLDQVLRAALEGISAQVVDSMEELWENGDHENGTERFQGCRILFAVPLGKNGVNRGYYEVLAWLRCGKPVLEGALAGFLIDADSELYTKAAARELAVAANQAGAALVGRPLVEGTASLDNYIIQAANMGTDRLGAYKKSAGILAEQLMEFQWNPRKEPHLLVLHASNHRTSNTLALWSRCREQLAETNERLSEENELICAENELKLQKARIEEKNRVYDSIFSQIQTQLLRMNQLLDEKGELGLLCVLGAYVKRRANLTLIREDTAAPSVDELVYCIRESLTYLTAYGTVCTLHQEGNGFISASDAQTAYDFFETCIEAALPTLSALIVRVRCEKELSVRLMMEDAADMPNRDSFAQAGEMTVDSSDGALCVTLDFREGGENS